MLLGHRRAVCLGPAAHLRRHRRTRPVPAVVSSEVNRSHVAGTAVAVTPSVNSAISLTLIWNPVVETIFRNVFAPAVAAKAA